MEECLYKRFKRFRNLNEISMYLFRWKRGGGCTNACICMETYSQPLLQNRLMDVYETLWGWSDHGLAHAWRCFGHICPGADLGRGKICHGGPLQKCSSSDWKATATNWIHSNDLEDSVMKCWCLWKANGVKILTLQPCSCKFVNQYLWFVVP